MPGDVNIVISPSNEGPLTVPQMPLTDYLHQRLNELPAEIRERKWMVDVTTGKFIRFNEVVEKSKRLASGLSKLGFGKNDVLFFVTYETAQMFIAQIAVWNCAGAVRGSYQGEDAEEYARQMCEIHCKIVLVDSQTAPVIREAVKDKRVNWKVVLLCVGDVPVEGIQSIEDLMMNDDGKAYPTKLDVDFKNDIVSLPNTSGSTGVPKSVIHTHYSCNAMIKNFELIDFFPKYQSMISLMSNFAVGNLMLTLNSFCQGMTIYNIGKFEQAEYFPLLMKHKPENIVIYPYVATWFSRSKELDTCDMSFLKKIFIGGAVLDPTTNSLLAKKLPHTKLLQLYGLSEIMMVSTTDDGKNRDKQVGALPTIENDGELCVSSGTLLPYTEAKIIDPETGKSMGRMERGEILCKSPYMMRGYLVQGSEPNRADIDDEGWLHTGDLGFFDEKGNIYVKERVSFMFKYYMQYVSPADVEKALAQHPAVQSAGVIGVPNVETTSLTTGYVVLNPGQTATAEELQKFVVGKVPPYMELIGGVRFLDKLPVNRGGKIDRAAIMKIALAEKNKK